uniref:ORF57e n=1 Tax=Pinus koraiensis TaxID=88728 RepID=A4QM90_PINKO|nr:ORF57e [Pinus koraiensis]ABP35427.1 ORF57e [Pinus koraiensis]
MTNGKFIENCNLHRVIVHLHVSIDVVLRLEDLEPTIETLDCPDTYSVRWPTHVYCPG